MMFQRAFSSFFHAHLVSLTQRASKAVLSVANDFLQRTLVFQDIFYMRHKRVTKR